MPTAESSGSEDSAESTRALTFAASSSAPEGTLAMVTKIAVRLLRQPESVKTLLAIFQELDDASAAVSGIIGAGIVPAAIEMMDDICIRAVEPAVNAGYPAGAGAVLLVEVDGLAESVEEEVAAIEEVCSSYNPLEIRTATEPRSARKALVRQEGRPRSPGPSRAQLHPWLTARFPEPASSKSSPP